MTLNEDPVDDAIESAIEHLDDGDPASALAALEGLPAGDPEVALTSTEAWLELGDPNRARSALGASELPPEDPDRLWLEGQILLREWRLGEAERAFGELHERAESAMSLTALALCRELDGDFTSADAYLAAASELDPDAYPLPTRVDAETFDRVVKEALGELPAEFQNVLGALRFLIEPMPARERAGGGGPATVPPGLLGLFTGPTLGELGGELPEPPRVYLFQRNIERVARDEDELRLEIRTTLYHEIGHFLGHDEEGVEDMGLA